MSPKKFTSGLTKNVGSTECRSKSLCSPYLSVHHLRRRLSHCRLNNCEKTNPSLVICPLISSTCLLASAASDLRWMQSAASACSLLNGTSTARRPTRGGLARRRRVTSQRSSQPTYPATTFWQQVFRASRFPSLACLRKRVWGVLTASSAPHKERCSSTSP